MIFFIDPAAGLLALALLARVPASPRLDTIGIVRGE